MASHNIRHVVLESFAALMITSMAVGCGGAPKPGVKVIGVSGAQDRNDASEILLVFLEVKNPTQRNITLSRLEYDLDAAPWFETSGHMQMRRTITPGGSAIVQIPVRLARADADAARGGRDVAYAFTGKLFIERGAGEATWPVSIKGRLASMKGSDRRAYMVRPTRDAR